MAKTIRAPAKWLWTLRYKKAKCPKGKLKTPTKTGRVCKKR